MNRKMRFSVSLVCFAICFSCVPLQASSWSSNVNLIHVKAFTDQSQHYISVANFSNPDGCQVLGTVVLNRDDSANWKMVHSLFLTALVSGSAVDVRVDGCDSQGFAVVDGVSINKN